MTSGYSYGGGSARCQPELMPGNQLTSLKYEDSIGMQKNSGRLSCSGGPILLLLRLSISLFDLCPSVCAVGPDCLTRRTVSLGFFVFFIETGMMAGTEGGFMNSEGGDYIMFPRVSHEKTIRRRRCCTRRQDRLVTTHETGFPTIAAFPFSKGYPFPLFFFLFRLFCFCSFRNSNHGGRRRRMLFGEVASSSCWHPGFV